MRSGGNLQNRNVGGRVELSAFEAAAAELVETRSGDSGTAPEVVVAGLCSVGGELYGSCEGWALLSWYRRWKRDKTRAATWNQSREVPVDPASMELVAGAAAEDEGPGGGGVAGRSNADVAAGLLRLMDGRLLRAPVEFRETQAALAPGDTVCVAQGPGRVQCADGRWVEWMAGAVILRAPDGVARRVFAECVLVGRRAPGDCPHGTVRMRRMVVKEGAVDAGGMLQAVGTLLLMFKGDAAGMTSHAEVARATGMTRANGSAKARRIAAEVVKAGNKPSFAVLRSRETVGKKGGGVG